MASNPPTKKARHHSPTSSTQQGRSFAAVDSPAAALIHGVRGMHVRDATDMEITQANLEVAVKDLNFKQRTLRSAQRDLEKILDDIIGFKNEVQRVRETIAQSQKEQQDHKAKAQEYEAKAQEYEAKAAHHRGQANDGADLEERCRENLEGFRQALAVSRGVKLPTKMKDLEQREAEVNALESQITYLKMHLKLDQQRSGDAVSWEQRAKQAVWSDKNKNSLKELQEILLGFIQAKVNAVNRSRSSNPVTLAWTEPSLMHKSVTCKILEEAWEIVTAGQFVCHEDCPPLVKTKNRLRQMSDMTKDEKVWLIMEAFTPGRA